VLPTANEVAECLIVRTIDLYAGIELTGSVSKAQATEICVNPHYGLIVTGGVTGNVLYWEASTTPFTFYNKDFVFASKVYFYYCTEDFPVNHFQCFGSVDEPSASARRRSLPEISASHGTIPHLDQGTPTNPGAKIIVTDTKANEKREIGPVEVKRDNTTELTKRVDGVPFIDGLFNCPNVDDQIGEDNTDNDIYSDGRPMLFSALYQL
jgi:hypothetical protein